jgi:Glycosyl hydrolase family 53
VTLGDASTTALVNISYGTTAGSLTAAPDAQQQSVPAGEPVYWPSGRVLIRARYVKIDVTDNDGTPPCIGELRLFAPAPLNAISARGADLSFEPQEEAAGAHFSDSGVPRFTAFDPQCSRPQLRAAAVVGEPAARLQRPRERPADGAARQGRGRQAVPRHSLLRLLGGPHAPGHSRRRQGQDLSQLTSTVQNYTAQVIGAFAAQRTPVDMVSIGNEIRNGILWPVGEVNWSTDTGWDNLTTLLKAGVAGARSQPAWPQAAGDAPLRRGGQQRRQRAVLRPHGLRRRSV